MLLLWGVSIVSICVLVYLGLGDLGRSWAIAVSHGGAWEDPRQELVGHPGAGLSQHTDIRNAGNLIGSGVMSVITLKIGFLLANFFFSFPSR